MTTREASRRFHFLREIAAGGFGSVYLTKVMHADGFSRLAAVKLLHRRWSENEEIARRMRDEARLLGWLRHRNLVDVVDLTSIDGRAAVVMEYLEAIDLKFIIQELAVRGEMVPTRVALEVMAAVASALDAAYNRPPYPGEKPLRVIHRDIKPSNVMIDDVGLVKVLDFGVARADFDSRESHTRELQFGSVDYMPPERLFFEPETPASDIYSLGASIYELMVLEKLGKARGRPQKHARFLADRMSYLRAALPLPAALATELENLLIECLSYEHSDRPSAADVYTRARALARRIDGPDLREWSEQVVPPLVRAFEALPREPNPLVDQVLLEDSVALEEANAAPRQAAEPEVPRNDARWEALRQAALEELRPGSRDRAGAPTLAPELPPPLFNGAQRVPPRGPDGELRMPEAPLPPPVAPTPAPAPVPAPLPAAGVQPVPAAPAPTPEPPPAPLPPPVAAPPAPEAPVAAPPAPVPAAPPPAPVPAAPPHASPAVSPPAVSPPAVPPPPLPAPRGPLFQEETDPSLAATQVEGAPGDEWGGFEPSIDDWGDIPTRIDLNPIPPPLPPPGSAAAARAEQAAPPRAPAPLPAPAPMPVLPAVSPVVEPVVEPVAPPAPPPAPVEPAPPPAPPRVEAPSAFTPIAELPARVSSPTLAPFVPDGGYDDDEDPDAATVVNIADAAGLRPATLTEVAPPPEALPVWPPPPEPEPEPDDEEQDPEEEDAPTPSKGPGVWLYVLVGVLALSTTVCLGGLVLFREPLLARLSGPGEAPPTPTAPPPTPEASPTPAAEAGPPAGPHLAFRSLAEGTRKLTVNCGQVTGKGAELAYVALESAPKCSVTAYLADDRLTAVVTDATAGEYRCFAGGDTRCER